MNYSGYSIHFLISALSAASFLESKGLNPKVIEGGMKAIHEVGK